MRAELEGEAESNQVSTVARRTFSSLAVRSYRLYFIGQTISLSGTWMQAVAQAWLVLKLTGSGTALGLVTALQYLPVLVFGPLGGLIADRIDKRTVLYITQVVAALLAATLGIVVLTDVVRLWMVYVLAAGLGGVTLFDNPARQTFVLEMVGPQHLRNALTLNSVMVNLARVLGPAVGAVLIATVGLGTCFIVNAASYLAMLVALMAMRAHELHSSTPQPRRKGQLREGLRYVRSTPALFAPLLMIAIIGTLAFEFQVTLPLVAKYTFHGDAGSYGAMSSFMGGGAVVGGLLTASRAGWRPTMLSGAAMVFGLVILAAAAAPTMAFELAALALVGAASITFLALANTTLQLATSEAMRGRVMALWTIAFIGSTPVGGPIVGWVGQHVGPRYGLALGGLGALVAGLLGHRGLVAIERRPAPAAGPAPALIETEAGPA